MVSKPNALVVETPEAFCRRISSQLTADGFDVELSPGDHLVDDAGADSLVVMHYVLLLQDLGLNIDLSAFDTDLLNTDLAYRAWVRRAISGVSHPEPNEAV